MPDFKYTIGQTVALREAVEQMEREQNTPQRLTVLSRLHEECHGGVQVHYGVRVVGTGLTGGGFDPNLIRLFEFELVPYPELPPRDRTGEVMSPEQALVSATAAVQRAQLRYDTAKANMEAVLQKKKAAE